MLDELCRKSKSLSDCWDTIIICYVNNINAVFQSFRCSDCETCFNTTFNLERQLITCKEPVKIVYPRNVYQIRETFFDQPGSFGIKYTSEQKLFKNIAIFDFESICVQEIFKDTNATPVWGNVSQFLYPFFRNLCKNQFSFAPLILITLLHPFWELLKV